MTDFGYAGRILRVDLYSKSTNQISTEHYADCLGGRGMAAKLYWDEVPTESTAFDAKNILVFAVGPLAGLPVLGTSRWVACGKSCLTTPEHFCYSNLGGRWGAEMKFAGYDAIVIQGKSDRPVYLFLDGETTEFKDAASLWGRGAIETREMLKSELGKSVKVVAIGPAGENLASEATLLADNDASGSGGLGATMGSKKLKAIAVRATERRLRIAQPERLKELTAYFRQLRRIPLRISPNRCTIDDDPVLNVRRVPGPKMKKDPCYGCLCLCFRRLYEAQDGSRGKFVCDSAMLYQPWAEKYYGDWNDVPFRATRLCDDYGLDSNAINLMIGWLELCYKEGIISDTSTGMPLSKIGSQEFIETLVRKVSLREGFGDTLAQGITKAADTLGHDAQEVLGRAGFFSKPGYSILYDPRLFIITGLLYAMEPRTPIQLLHHVSGLVNKWVCWAKGLEGAHMDSTAVHAIAKRFLGSEVAADFSTYQGKALASKTIQDREYAKESLILCDWVFPIMDLEDSENHVGDPTLESKILSAVIGKEVSEEELYRVGERIFNLQRAIMVREGHKGRGFDQVPEHCYSVPLEWYYFSHECLVPGKEGQVMSRKGAVLDRTEFERMKDEYYHLRGWHVPTGLQTRTKLEELGLRDVGDELEQRGQLVA